MKSILVIDDESATRTMLRLMLEDAGFAVVEAEHGRKGVELYAGQPTDLVITDIIMPEQEGLETIRSLKHSFPALKIIAMSGGGRICSQNYLDMAIKIGADRILDKPFGRGELLQAIRHVLDMPDEGAPEKSSVPG